MLQPKQTRFRLPPSLRKLPALHLKYLLQCQFQISDDSCSLLFNNTYLTTEITEQKIGNVNTEL